MRGGTLLQWLAVLALLPGLWRLDRWLSHGGEGPERHAVEGGLARAADKPAASGLVILGSSTSRDWMTFKRLVRYMGEDPENVLDAHINGCHQGCTWAQVRGMLARGRHFRVALYGLNQFHMCDDGHSKRVLQHRMLTPREDLPALLRHYARAEDPLRKVGQLLTGSVSAAYADGRAVRARLRAELFGRGRPAQEHRWIRAEPIPAPRVRYCSPDGDAFAFKRGLLEDLVEDLTQLADHVFLLMLPDESLSSPDPAVAGAWRAHRQLLTELSDRSEVTLVDLTNNGPYTRELFRDGAHLNRSAYARQFGALLRALEPVRREADP